MTLKTIIFQLLFVAVLRTSSLENFEHICPVTGNVVRGTTWHEHSKRSRTSNECLSVAGKKYKVGETFVDATAKWECVREGDSGLKIVPVACVLNGLVLEEGDHGQLDKFHYQCVKRENGVSLEIIGCSDKTGYMVPIGQEFLKGSLLYQCAECDGKVYTQVVGCIVDGERYTLGQKGASGDFVIQCQSKGKRSARIEIIGCVGDRGFFYPGQTFAKGFIRYECVEVAQGDKMTLDHVAIGCLKKEKTGEMKDYEFGDKWVETYKKNTAFKMQCQKNGDKMGPVIVSCEFYQNSGKISLEPGCGTIVDDQVFLCKQEEKGVKLRRKSIPSGQSGAAILEEVGINLCEI